MKTATVLQTKTGRNITRKDREELTLTLVRLNEVLPGNIEYQILFDDQVPGQSKCGYRSEKSGISNFRNLCKVYFG